MNPSFESPTEERLEDSSPARGALGLWDAVSIIVGIVVGSSIFQVAPTILGMSGTSGMALSLWAVGGLLSLIGAFVYAELATAYPRDGGDYVYLTRAFGRWLGFLFGWAQLAVILTTSISMMAFVYAGYAGRVWKGASGPTAEAINAVLAVVVLTAFNILGVVFGKTVQNVLSVLKVLGLGAILAVGFLYHNPEATWGPIWPTAAKLNLDPLVAFSPLAIAMILILYAYGGWNDAAFVAAEVRDVKRNIKRALFFGIFIITVLYVLVNAAYVSALGYAQASKSSQIAADVLKLPLGDFGEVAMSLVVMISALGAVNGLTFAGARVYSTLGRDHAVFRWMGRWSNSRGTPTIALLAQAGFAIAMIVLVGTPDGQKIVKRIVEPLGVAMPEEAWKPNDGFDYLFACSAPVFWFFFLLTGLSLFVLRIREPQVERPFRVPLFPVIPAIFCLSCAFWIYRSLIFVIEVKKATGGFLLIGALPLLIGLPLYALSRLLEGGKQSL